jgi:predicted glutamine amidotransferase
VGWIADNLPVFALNLIIATPDDVWALRYPDTHELYVLDRTRSAQHLEVSSPRIRTRSDELSGAPAVIIASEPMDGETGWRLVEPGELLHIAADLTITSSHPLPASPRHQLTLTDLSPTAAASQGAAAQKTT